MISQANKKRKSTEDTVKDAANIKKSNKKDSSSLYNLYFSKEAYQKRLRTFTSATYFAKPIQLSPLTVARFG